MEAPVEVEWSTAGKWRRRPAQPATVLTGSAPPPLYLTVCGDQLPPLKQSEPPPSLKVRNLLGDALREENRLEKYLSTDTPADIISSCRRMAQLLREEVSNIERQIKAHIKASPALRRDYTLLTSIKSVGPQLGCICWSSFAAITLYQLSRLPLFWAWCRSRNAQAHRSGAGRGCRKSPPLS